MSEQKQYNAPESQKQRWLKYGGNVALVSLVVIVLALVVTWLAQEVGARVDTTSAGLYSLKPQTLNIIRNNKQKIRIYSLYTRNKKRDPNAVVRPEDEFDYVQPVNDLLYEYKRKGSNIEVEFIDPNEQPLKVDQLISHVTSTYGGEVEAYRKLTAEYGPVYDQIGALATQESQRIQSLKSVDDLKRGAVKPGEWADLLGATIQTVYALQSDLKSTRERVDRFMQEKIPDYKQSAEAIRSGVETLVTVAGRLAEFYEQRKDDKEYPQDVREYLAEALPRMKQLKQLADDLDKRVKSLGELKLDDLKRSLEQDDTILVLGDKGVRVLPRYKVWQEANERTGPRRGEPTRPRFAGEQQVTSAILSLSSEKKQKVAFVRAGGPPLTQSFDPWSFSMSLLAERLRDYNYEVLEKDLSGMWAMQAQMRGAPPTPEPSDEEIKDAVWVVVTTPAQRSPMMPPTSSAAGKLAEHLNAGGSALVLAHPRGEDFAEALGPWGVRIRTDAMAVHERVAAAPTQSGDPLAEIEREPIFFFLNDFGDHKVVKPLRSLTGLLFPMLVVQTEQKQGFQSQPILPVPTALKVWGETDMASIDDGKVEYNPPKDGAPGDLPPPLYGGSIVEKEGGARLVVIGSLFAMNDVIVAYPDTRERRPVLRFPANGDLFMNSIFWLSRQDPLIDISPAAMEVNRIKAMGGGALNFWRVGVLLVLLPMLVIAGGVVTYIRRRD